MAKDLNIHGPEDPEKPGATHHGNSGPTNMQRAEADALVSAELPQADTRMNDFEALFVVDVQRMNPRSMVKNLNAIRSFMETNPDLAGSPATRARMEEYCRILVQADMPLSLIETVISNPSFQAFIREPLVQNAARKRMLDELQTHGLHQRFKDILAFQRTMEIPVDQELRGALITSVTDRMCAMDREEDVQGFREICDAFGINVEGEIHPLAIDRIHSYLKYGAVKDAVALQTRLSLPQESFFQALPVRMLHLARACGVTTLTAFAAFYERNSALIGFMTMGWRQAVDRTKMPELFRELAAQEKLTEGSRGYAEAMEVLLESGLLAGDARTIQQLQQAFALPASVEECPGLPAYTKSIARTWHVPTIEGLANFCQKERDFALFVADSPNPTVHITEDDVPHIHAAHLTLIEAEELKRAKEDIRPLADAGREAYGKKIQALHRHCKSWQSITLSHLRRLSLEENHPKDLSFYLALNVLPEQWQEIERSCGLETLQDLFDILSLRNELIKRILSFPPDKRPAYIAVLRRMMHCPSQEMHRVQAELMEQLLETDDPVGSYEKIETLFVKNNLPLVGKIFRVFQILHSPNTLTKKLESSYLSPYLQHATPRRRYQIIFNDLLRVHIRSGNRSLRQFLEILRDSEQDLLLLEMETDADLDPEQSRRLALGLAKFEAALAQSQLGVTVDPSTPTRSRHSRKELRTRYQQLRVAFGVEEGVPLHQRVVDMFCRPSGCETVAEVLEQMRAGKQTANQRSDDLLHHQTDGALMLGEGDLLKGVDACFIAKILQNGSVAKEYLGPSSQSDATPFDTDVSMVSADDASKGFEEAVNKSLAQAYGDLLFVLKKENHVFERTDTSTTVFENKDHLELFSSGVVGEKHYGIRTGFGSTEIDFMIVKGELAKNPHLLRNLYTEIARNGWYIPVTDTHGTVLLTREDYQRYRKAFTGIDRYDGGMLQLSKHSNALFQNQLNEQMDTMEQDQRKLESAEHSIEAIIASVLAEYGVELKFSGDLSLGGARLQNTGSTARRTNIESTADGNNQFDFDFIVTLEDTGRDPPFHHAQEIGRKIAERLRPASDNSHAEANGYYQMRFQGAGALEGADIDIGFAPYSELIEEGSHNILAEQLRSISCQPDGTRKANEVRANIVLAKKILKKGHAYKKVEDGGFGGIGVEHWILQNEGNMLSAFQTFLHAASDGHGGFLPLSDFKSRYMILGPGINVKFGTAGENFTEKLTDDGYQHLCQTIIDYLRSVNELPEGP